MPLTPDEQAIIDTFASNPPEKALSEMTLDEYRALCHVFTQYTGEPADVPFENHELPMPDGHKNPMRIYNSHLGADAPVLIFHPGCGYLVDLYEANATACSRIAAAGNIKVLIVNPRLTPEHPVPQPIQDAIDATRYLIEHATEFNLNTANLSIGGVSSGAHSCAVIASMARHDKTLSTIKQQIILNGVFDISDSYHAFDEYADQDLLCSEESFHYLLSHWNLSEEQKLDPMISPSLEKDLSGLMPTRILVGEYDRLRNHAEFYDQQLKAAGNKDVVKMVLPGQTHNTILLRGAIQDSEDPAVTIARLIMA